jgi:hypothetical protein
MKLSAPAQTLLEGPIAREKTEPMESQLERFSKASAEEQGLVNLTQGGVILERSKQLVQRLVTQGRLTPFEFFGRTYLSVRELKEFQRVERLPGRPWGKKIIAAANLALSSLTDPAQRRHDVTKDFEKPGKAAPKKEQWSKDNGCGLIGECIPRRLLKPHP